MIHIFKENPNHCLAELSVYVPLNAGVSKDEMMRSIMNAIEVQVILDLRNIELSKAKR